MNPRNVIASSILVIWIVASTLMGAPAPARAVVEPEMPRVPLDATDPPQPTQDTWIRPRSCGRPPC